MSLCTYFARNRFKLRLLLIQSIHFNIESCPFAFCILFRFACPHSFEDHRFYQKQNESIQLNETMFTYLFICILYAVYTASYDRSCMPGQRASPCSSENWVSSIRWVPSAWWSTQGPAVCSHALASSSVSF